MTRNEMIDRLVSLSRQWNIKDPQGNLVTPETFARASDDWLARQIKSFQQAGRKLSRNPK